MHRNTRFFLHLVRFSDDDLSTKGLLYINDRFQCFTLENPFQETKIPGKTRIPNGIYELAIKESSPMSDKYKKRYPDMHNGMIWIKNIPNFESVYIHVGNTPNDTEGCILVGETFSLDGMLASSSVAYIDLYEKIIDTIKSSKQFIAIGELNHGLSVNYI